MNKPIIKHVEGNRRCDVREALNLVLVTRVSNKAIYYYTYFPAWVESSESDYWLKKERLELNDDVLEMRPGGVYLVYSVGVRLGDGFTKYGQVGKFEYTWMKTQKIEGDPRQLAADLRMNHVKVMSAFRSDVYPDEIEFNNYNKPGLLEF